MKVTCHDIAHLANFNWSYYIQYIQVKLTLKQPLRVQHKEITSSYLESLIRLDVSCEFCLIL